jgi:hypothetical protein
MDMSPKAETAGLVAFIFTPLRTLLAVALFAAIFTSCHRKTGPIAQEQTNLSWLGSMYGMYVSENKGRPPKNVDELRKFVDKATSAEQLSRLKVASANDLFTSPHDGKPFTMVSYDKLPAPAAGQPQPLVLYEAQGQNGQRATALLGGGTMTVDDSELQKLLPPQAKTAR